MPLDSDRADQDDTTLAERSLTALQAVRGELAGGETREAQNIMIEAVANTISHGGAIMVKAGTGTGKSLAYLIPASLSVGRAVIATATHTLQAQLVDKDLPTVQTHVNPDLTWGVVKGRQSYLCRAALAELIADPEPPIPSVDVLGYAAWAGTTRRGERDDHIPRPDDDVWNLMSIPGAECPGAKHCEWGHTCFAEAARRKASTAKLVIATGRLYSYHLLSPLRVFADHSTVVIDECHHFEDDLENTFGVTLTTARVSGLLARAAKIPQLSGGELDCFAGAASRFAEALASDESLHFGEPAGSGKLASKLLDLGVATTNLAETLDGLVEAGLQVKGLRRTALSANSLAHDALAAGVGTNSDSIRFVETVNNRRAVRIVPTNLSAICSRTLWGQRSVIMCSGDATTILARRLGLPESNFLELASPWDWQNRAMLYIPAMPSPSQAGWEQAVLDHTAHMVTVAEGRALVLSTSRRMLTQLARGLKEALQGAGKVLVQGDSTKAQLLNDFRADEHAVLVATRSFFTGVDAPGTTLSLVVVDRLPFPAPVDKLVAAKRQLDGSGGFSGVDLAYAAVALNQAIGRLIRRSDDSGVVMVTDPRLAEGSYSKKLLSQLPPMRVTRDEGVARRFARAAITGRLTV